MKGVKIKLTRKEAKTLTKFSAKDSAEILGISLSQVYCELRERGLKPARDPHWTDTHLVVELIGVLPDQEVADMAGVSVNSVRLWRWRHGIPACRPACRVREELDPELESTLGTDEDSVIGERFGRSRMSIRGLRLTRGIPSFRQSMRGGK